MQINFHSHALQRMKERGAKEEEVIAAIESGEGFEAKFGRHGFRRNFVFEGEWNGKYYGTKQLEVYTVEEVNSLLVITVLVKYF